MSTIENLKAEKTNRSRIYFCLFVLSIGLHKSNYLISKLIGLNIQSTIKISLLTFPIFFLYLAYHYSDKKITVFDKTVKHIWLQLILVYVHLLMIYGILRGNSIMVIVYEYWICLVALYSYKLAANQQIWNSFRNVLFIIFLVFSVLVGLGMGYMAEHFELENLSDKLQDITTATLAYEMSPMLDFWPFLFLLGFAGKKLGVRLLAFLPLFIYLFFQLFFLKRAPTARAISFVIVAYTLLMFFRSTINLGQLLKYVFGIAIICFIIYLLLPEALMERFQTEDTARQDESKEMLMQMNPIEHIVGKGLGGNYLLSDGGGVIALDKDGNLGKDITHIAISYPYLKGGIIFIFLILAQILTAVCRGLFRIKSLTPEQFAGLGFLIVYCSYRLIEGPFSTGAVFDAVLFGMSLGALSSLKKLKIRQKLKTVMRHI